MPTELRLSDVYENNPFALFEMKNFFDQEIYESLHKEFPDKSYFSFLKETALCRSCVEK